MSRIAILHYTASPAIGGIETLMQSQCATLVELGHSVRFIVGRGMQPPGGELIRLPELHPSDPPVQKARAGLQGILPPPDHPLVDAISKRLRGALKDCDQCWVHNAFTVYLNPFLTMALLRLTSEMKNLRWVAWCSDLSGTSAFVPALSPPEQMRTRVLDPPITYVTISYVRRTELSAYLGAEEDSITVVPPPLAAYEWLGVGNEARKLARRLDLELAEPIVLVPAKLLPHKNLGLAVHVATHLRTRASRPKVLLTGIASPHDPDASEAVRDGLVQLIHDLDVEKSVHLLTYPAGKPLDWRTIRDLMLLSDLVLLPSAEEGFGMPIREAAALRTPVLCSDIAPFREAGVAYAHYFSLHATPDAIAAQILAMSRLPVNQIRRDAIQSRLHFRSQLEDLLTARPLQ